MKKNPTTSRSNHKSVLFFQKSREEVQELKVELDMIKMECQDQKKKGNSLFSEVNNISWFLGIASSG